MNETAYNTIRTLLIIALLVGTGIVFFHFPVVMLIALCLTTIISICYFLYVIVTP